MALPTATDGRASRRVYAIWLLALLLLPAGVLLIGIFAYPIGALLSESFWIKGVFTFENYERIFTKPLYLNTLVRTLRIGALTTVICLFAGFPLACWLNRLKGPAFYFVLACILVPLWTSILVRNYAWVVLLQPNGLINQLLLRIGLIERPAPLLYSEGAMLVATVHILLPYMVFPIYNALRNIPANLSRAAQSLGSGIIAEFFTVTLPLARVGITAGCVMVFVLSIGFFITPALLGGPRTLMISTLINQQVSSVLNWSFGGALGAMLLVATLLIILVFNKAMTTGRRTHG